MRDVIVDRIARTVFRLLQICALVFCLAPAFLVFGLSFFRDMFENFPPHEFTFQLYRDLAASESWRQSIWVSFKLGIPTAVFTVALVAPPALVLERARIRGKRILEFAVLVPLLMPAVGYAVALYVIFLKLGWVGGYFPLLLAESITISPVAFLVLRAALQRMPHHLDFVAMSLGASRMRAHWDVSVRLLRPAMLVAMLFVLVHVFDDATYVTFLGGPKLITVSKAIFDSMEYDLTPVVGALSAAFMVFMAVLITTATVVRGRGQSGAD